MVGLLEGKHAHSALASVVLAGPLESFAESPAEGAASPAQPRCSGLQQASQISGAGASRAAGQGVEKRS